MPSVSPRFANARIRGFVLALLVALSAVTLSIAVPAHADVVTVSDDDQRTGWDPNEPSLSAGAVTGSDFGELFSSDLTGQVYAQPLVVGSTVIVGTEENYVYGINGETGAIEWQSYLGPSWPASTIGCGDLVPDIGITSTPVYDPSSGYVYVTAKVNDGSNATVPHYYLYALNATPEPCAPAGRCRSPGRPRTTRATASAPSTSCSARASCCRTAASTWPSAATATTARTAATWSG